MKAETAYNVIQSLDPTELERLYAMIDRAAKAKQTLSKPKTHIWTVEECTEILLATHFNKSKRKHP